MHRNRRRKLRSATLLSVVTLVLTGPAGAEDKKPVESPRQILASDLVKNIEEIDPKRGWFRPYVHTKKGHGFEYSRSFQPKHRDRKLIFSIQGPFVKKKTPGIGFEIEF